MIRATKFSMATAAALLLLAQAAPVAQAHFIWLVPVSSDNGGHVAAYFGEDAEDDSPDYLDRIKDTKVFQLAGKRKPKPLQLELNDETLSAKVPGFGSPALFIGSHDLGVRDRGDKVFRLRYYAKGGPWITNDAWQNSAAAEHLLLDVVPEYDHGKITVTVQFEGQPIAGAQVKAIGPGLDDFEAETNEKGQVSFDMADAGLYSIRARYIDNQPGELDGKKYPETRHYSTVAVYVPSPLQPVASQTLTEMDEPVTSFGAAINAGKLYVYGGHTGTSHSYSKEEQGHELLSLDLHTHQWQTLADGPHLQGPALLTHGGKLYRIGGFTAMNGEGEDHDLRSQAGVAQFDPATKSWTDLPPLPEPRSSFDAAVAGDVIYVIGGWSMQGDDNRQWHTSAWKMDLSQSAPSWEPVPSPPFQRRALAVAVHDGKLYAIGGMKEKGGTTRQVDVLDLESGGWSRGPDILGDGGLAGFGCSAFATGGRLYVSTVQGHLQRLSEDGTAWEMVGATPTPRFFHRLLPVDDTHLLVVGGSNMQDGKLAEVELLSLTP